MEKCIRDYTVIYSQPSIEALENLIKDFIGTFGLAVDIHDMFCYGVFCKNITYANYKWIASEMFLDESDVPEILYKHCATPEEKLAYVDDLIDKIMCGEVEKPEWMQFIEMDSEVNEYGLAPSTFLYIKAKEPQYEALAQRLVEFLYSPNLLITMVKA